MLRIAAFADEANPNIDRQIEALKRNNIHLLEIRGVNGKNVLDLTNEEAELTYSKLKNNGIEVWSIGSPCGKIDVLNNEQTFLNSITRACELANIFHTKQIRMFSFFNAYEYKDLVMKYLKEAIEIAKKYNVYLCHENERLIYGDTADRVREILDNINELKEIYDPANYVLIGQDMDKAMDLLLDDVYYFHIKDACYTGEIVACGEGDGKLKETLSKFKKDATLTIEPHLKLFSGYNKIDKAQMHHTKEFSTSDEAFDYAVNSLKKTLIEIGYHEENGDYIL